MKHFIKEEVTAIQPSTIRSFDEETSAIPGIIKLTLGEPDFKTPACIKEAVQEALENDLTTYAPSHGTLELREAIAEYVHEHYELRYDPNNEIIVTIGASEAIACTLQTIVDEKDEVLIPTPIFPAYIPVTKLQRGVPIFVDTSKSNFLLTAELLRETIKEHPNIKVIILNFPNNPTGVTYTRKELEDLADEIKQHDVLVVSDEIYSELCFEENHTSIAKLLPKQTILINGLSKTFAMTGWRIGYLCAPKEIACEILKVHQFMVTCNPTPLQHAATVALRACAKETEQMRLTYMERRDYTYERLQQMGFKGPKPTGAFYIFAKIPEGFTQDSLAFCKELAYQAKVALIPGSCFGPGGEGYVRISYAASLETLTTAMDQIAAYIKGE